MLGRFQNQAPQPNNLDFSDINSRTRAEDLFNQDKLENLFLMPLEFGGVDNPMNTVYVPIGIAEIKAGIDRNIAKLAEEGKITEYSASPEYQGESFIPIAITIDASNPEHFSTTIAIWGDALSK